jgi:hypothetical protein
MAHASEQGNYGVRRVPSHREIGEPGWPLDPAHVLNASSPKTPATTGTPATDKTVRDHRGSNGAPQGGVSVHHGKSKTPQRIAQVPGPLGGPKNKGGYGGLNGSGDKGGADGPTIRDHRKTR